VGLVVAEYCRCQWWAEVAVVCCCWCPGGWHPAP
jgi:hypothetical protein